ncbi:RpL19 [Symbiodinium sp. CCMP2592]|nr:RpL19 [Symbiodinium sp. CCMP2592]
MRELARAAAAQAQSAAERKAEANRQLQSIESRECRTEAARAGLSAMERSLECSVMQGELAVSAELCAQEVEAFAAPREQRAEDDEDHAEAAKQDAEAEEERAMAAEEASAASVFQGLSFQGLLERVRKLIQDEIERAVRRTIEVESAIKEAVSYSEIRTKELLNCMEKAEPIESSPSQNTDLLKNHCSQRYAEAAPEAAFCKTCGHTLQRHVISDSGSPSLRGKKRRADSHLQGKEILQPYKW